jgi:predicted DNA-binding ribbon-helix-helix protein
MPEPMKSQMIKRSIAVAGRKTSVNLEDASWYALRRIASDRGLTIGDLVTAIDTERPRGNRSSAIRLFVRGSSAAPINADRS